MKHLITGGSGFIGNLVARALHERGEQTAVLDVWEDETRPREIEFFDCSVLNRDGVRKAVHGVDIVHHHAALVAQTNAGRRYWNVNVEGTRIVAEEAARAKVRAIVHLSSTSVYGIPPSGAITANTPTRPVEPYGRSKLAGEEVMSEICRAHGIPLITIRPRATLGAGRLGIFQVLFEWVRENRNVYVIGSGDIKFQLIHAHDLMEFYLIALKAGRAGTYNVGTDRFGTLRSELEGLIRYAKSSSRVVSLPESLAINVLRLFHFVRLSPLVPWHYLTYHKECYFDIDPLLKLGWRPRFSNAEMLQESYDWYCANAATINERGRSAHRSPLRPGVLSLLKRLS